MPRCPPKTLRCDCTNGERSFNQQHHISHSHRCTTNIAVCITLCTCGVQVLGLSSRRCPALSIVDDKCAHISYICCMCNAVCHIYKTVALEQLLLLLLLRVIHPSVSGSVSRFDAICRAVTPGNRCSGSDGVIRNHKFKAERSPLSHTCWKTYSAYLSLGQMDLCERVIKNRTCTSALVEE